MPKEADAAVDVSVIVAVRNGAKTLAHCIESVLMQEECAVELIVVDALSDDGTHEIVKSFGAGIATYIREADSGIYDAWNKALAAAQGKWCAFLGADDSYLTTTSLRELVLRAASVQPNPAVVYGGTLRTGPHTPYVLHPAPQNATDFVSSGRGVPIPSSIFQTSILRSVHGFRPELTILGDLDALIRVSKHGMVLRHDAVSAAMITGGVSDQWKNRGVRNQERYQIFAREFGSTKALVLNFSRFAPEYVSFAVEVTLRAMFGTGVGERIILLLRKALRKPPRVRHF